MQHLQPIASSSAQKPISVTRYPSSPPSLTRARSEAESDQTETPSKRRRIDEPAPAAQTEALPEMSSDMFAVMTAAVEALGDCAEAWLEVGEALGRNDVKPIKWKLKFLAAGGKAVLDAARASADSAAAVAPVAGPSVSRAEQQTTAPAPVQQQPRTFVIDDDDDDEEDEPLAHQQRAAGWDGDEGELDELEDDGADRRTMKGAPWTFEEREKLFSLCDASKAEFGFVRWADVLPHMGGRSRSSCENQTFARSQQNSNRGPSTHASLNRWTEEEDATLMAEAGGAFRLPWEEIGALVNRSAGACQQRYYENKKKAEARPNAPSVPSSAVVLWTVAERELLYSLCDKPGNIDWVRVLARMPGRTIAACRDQLKRRPAHADAFVRHSRVRWLDQDRQLLFSLYDANADSANVDWDAILPNFADRTLMACITQINERKKKEQRTDRISFIDQTRLGIRQSETWNDFLQRSTASTSAAPAPAPPPPAQQTREASLELNSDNGEQSQEEEEDEEFTVEDNLIEVINCFDDARRKFKWETVAELMRALGTPRTIGECRKLYRELYEADV